MSKRLKIVSLITLGLAAWLNIFSVSSADALSGSDLEVQKAILNGAWSCYQNGAVGAPISLQKTNGYTAYSGGKSILNLSNAREQNIALPTYFSGVAASGVASTPHQISCESLFFGGDSFNGIFSLNSVGNPPADTSNLTAVDSYLANMGYTKHNTDSTDDKTCIGVYFSDSRQDDLITSDKICFTNLSSDGRVTSETTVSIEDVKHREGNNADSDTTDYDPIAIVGSGSRAFKIEDGDWLKTKIELKDGDLIMSDNDTNAIANQMIRAAQSAYKNGCHTKTSDDGLRSWSYCLSQKDGSSIYYDPAAGSTSGTTYTLDSVSSAFEKARSYLKLPDTSAAYTATNKFILYQSYLAQYYNLSVACDKSSNAEETAKASGAGFTATVYAYHDGKFQDCLINVGNLKDNKKVMAVSSGGLFDGSTIDANQVIAELNSLKGVATFNDSEASRIGKYRNGVDSDGNYIPDPTKADPVGLTDPTTDPGNGKTSTTATEQCYSAAGTIGLGWILCPVLSGLSNTLNWVYSNIVTDYLMIETGLVSQNSVYETWQFFQNFANIIVVILLLVVIFSQLTGIGIDNYGIKKILPRLIVVAILINLSFFIVQFLVDISNIVGNGIAGIFNTSSISISPADYEGANIPSHILGIGLATAFGAGVASVVANPAILLSFLGVLLSGLISVLIMWIILTARKAGVVIALVIAPIAFAMYLLPNTSKFAKSWVNLVKGLLLVYPLAALLIGASFFASNLLAGVDDNMVLPAMLLRVVPFFALPTLFKKSLDAFGNLGTRIQGLGQTLSRSATGAMRNADFYKNAQERGAERRTRLRAGLDQNGNEQTGWRALLRSGNARNRSRYRSQYLKNQADQNRADLLNDPEYMAEMRFKQDFALEGERDEIRLMNDPNYRESLRANQREALEKKQKDVQASMLKTGNFTYRDLAGNEQTITDPSSGKELQDALVAELSRSDGDISKINALYDAIRAKGDAGIDLLSNVWDSGTLDTSGRGFIEFRDKIVADGEIKSKARTFHSVAKDVQSGKLGYTGNQVTDARAAGNYVADIAAEKVPDLTSKELDALNVRAQGGDAVAQETIYRALANPDINSKIKGEDRNNVLLSGAHYFKNNFNQIDHTDDQVEIWTGLNPNTGKQETKEFGRTKEGIYFDASTGRDNKGNPLYGNPVNIGEYKGWGYQKTN